MDSLIAYMDGIHIGQLTRLNDGLLEFSYSPAWLNNKNSKPISLSLPLQPETHTSCNVINYFDNLLPDLTETKNKIVDHLLSDSTHTFELLKLVGKDCVGAVSLYPLSDQPSPNQLDYDVLSENDLARVLSAHLHNIPLGMLDKKSDFRITVSGAQEKTALLKVGDSWCIPKGSTPTSHIIKLPIGEIKQPNATLDMSESVENEYLCLLLAKALGFNVAEAEIISSMGIKALAIKRFDREWVTDCESLIRLPQEDMCQVFGMPSSKKYESDGGIGIKSIMDLLLGSSQPDEDRDTFMRFMVFQWLVGATDGHAKNFSINIGNNGTYCLTPLYDIMSAYPMVGGIGLSKQALRLAMGLKATKGKKYKLDQIYARHFIATAQDVGFNVDRMNNILDEMAAMLPLAIEMVKQQLPNGFPETVSGPIFVQSLKKVRRLSMGR